MCEQNKNFVKKTSFGLCWVKLKKASKEFFSTTFILTADLGKNDFFFQNVNESLNSKNASVEKQCKRQQIEYLVF